MYLMLLPSTKMQSLADPKNLWNSLDNSHLSN